LQVTFSAKVVRPFVGVTLGIGGSVETYWKSMALPVSTPASKGSELLPAAATASAATSPSNHSGVSHGGHATTVSSVTGTYLHAVVQITRDGCPVVFAERELPEVDYDLCVPDVTLAQFDALAARRSRRLDAPLSTLASWRTALKRCMVSLQALLQVRLLASAIARHC
jgi:CDK inhibitor PHO81